MPFHFAPSPTVGNTFLPFCTYVLVNLNIGVFFMLRLSSLPNPGTTAPAPSFSICFSSLEISCCHRVRAERPGRIDVADDEGGVGQVLNHDGLYYLESTSGAC